MLLHSEFGTAHSSTVTQVAPLGFSVQRINSDKIWNSCMCIKLVSQHQVQISAHDLVTVNVYIVFNESTDLSALENDFKKKH